MRNLKITKQITNRTGKSIEMYLKEVAAEDMISPEEEVKLAERIKQGDEKALEKLVRANLRFVISVAKQYQFQGLELEDLINEGNLGLIEAAKRFDETRGFKFISYAVWWIRQSIIKAISQKSRRIRVPSNRVLDARKIAEAAMQIEQENERKASIEEIGEAVNMSKEVVQEVMGMISKQSSIDAPLVDGDSTFTMSEVLEDENVPNPTDHLMEESLTKEIEYALSKIDKYEAEVIRLSFGLSDDGYAMTLKDISEKLGITTERVRQIKKRALRNLRNASNSEILKSYLA